MRLITDKKEIEKTRYYMELAFREARNSVCKKAQRGVVIVKNNEIISKGYNKPLIEEYCCLRDKIHDNSKIELCSAVHAEEMAILKSPRNGLVGATMYHIKVKNREMVPSGKPSCPSCGKSVLYSGIKEFVLWHKDGYYIYNSEEFNRLSIEYFL